MSFIFCRGVQHDARLPVVSHKIAFGHDYRKPVVSQDGYHAHETHKQLMVLLTYYR
jgi:hypothetical protein